MEEPHPISMIDRILKIVVVIGLVTLIVAVFNRYAEISMMNAKASSGPAQVIVIDREPASAKKKSVEDEKLKIEKIQKGAPLKVMVLDRPTWMEEKEAGALKDLFMTVKENSKVPMELTYSNLEKIRAAVDDHKIECVFGLSKNVLARVPGPTWIDSEDYFIARIMAYALKTEKRPEALSAILDQRIVAPQNLDEELLNLKKAIPELYYATNLEKAIGELQGGRAKYMFAMMPLPKASMEAVRVGPRVSVAIMGERLVCSDTLRTRDVIALLNKEILSLRRSPAFEQILLKYYTKEQVRFVKTYH